MNYRIYLSPPDVGELEEEFVLDALRSGWVAPLGPHVEAFEQEVADLVRVKHAVALSSGTAALHLGLLALGVKPGDEVILPTMTFAASAFAVAYIGAVPVFLDSERSSYNLDPDLLEAHLTERARRGQLPAAVIVVDIYGQTADFTRILPMCAEYGVPVIEDAAEALGSEHEKGKAGSFGRVAVFSFNGNKIITSSGGGMAVTNDAEIDARIRHLSTQAREAVPWYEHREVGFNYRMSNLLAAVGRAQLRRLPEFVAKRTSIHRSYSELLDGPAVHVVTDARWSRSNHWLTLVRLPAGQVEHVREGLSIRGIEARRAWKPMHRQPVFQGCSFGGSNVADNLFDEGLCLPSGSRMTRLDVEDVCHAVLSLVRDSQPVDADKA